MNGYRHLRIDALATLVLLIGVQARTEQPSASPPAPTESAILSTKIKEAVTAKLPKYVAPTPAKLPDFNKPKEAGDQSDDMLHLPKMTVRPATTLPASDFAFLSPKGRMELAMKNSPGLGIGNIFGLNQGIAMAIQAEERDVQKKATLTEMIERTTIDDSEATKRIRLLLQAAVQRANSDWATARGGQPERP